MNLTQANALMAAYNRVEAEQTARLRELFDFIDSRKGYRHVKFGESDMWSNCWGRSSGTFSKEKAYELFVDTLARTITDFEPGIE